MMLRSQKLKTVRAGLGGLLLAISVTGTAAAAHAQVAAVGRPLTNVVDPAPATIDPTVPLPVSPAPEQAA